MTYSYKLVRSVDTGAMLDLVKRIEDQACIPFDLGNADYQKYLEWVGEGNTPDPAD